MKQEGVSNKKQDGISSMKQEGITYELIEDDLNFISRPISLPLLSLSSTEGKPPKSVTNDYGSVGVSSYYFAPLASSSPSSLNHSKTTPVNTSTKRNSGNIWKRSYSVNEHINFMEAAESPADQVSVESSDKYSDERPNFQGSLPSNYLDPRGHFPSRDLYLHTIKSQYFSLGVSAGASMQMFFVSFLLMFVSTSDNAGPIRELSHEYYPVFRGVFLLTFFFCLYGTCVFIWQRNKIDYCSTLGVSYAHTYQYILRGSSSVSYIIFSCFMLYILTLTGGLDVITFISQNYLKHLWPALAVFVPLSLFFFPFDEMTVCCFGVIRNGFRQRMDLLKDLATVLFTTPFADPLFRHCFIADVLCSMPKVFPDLQYTLCIYATGTYWVENENEWKTDNHLHGYYTCGVGNKLYLYIQIFLGLFPFSLRFCQCLKAYSVTGLCRHLFNTFKYALSMSVMALATAMKSFDAETNHFLGQFWVIFGIIATIYSFYWDVVMDWGLGNLKSPHIFLRDELYYAPYLYYIAILCDLVMRLGWALVISPEQPYLQQHFVLMLGVIELVRRFLWSIIRIEWEWLRNQSNEMLRKKQSRSAGSTSETNISYHNNSDLQLNLLSSSNNSDLGQIHRI